MNDVFVYWDNSNVYHEAQRLADEREGTPGARYRRPWTFCAAGRRAQTCRTRLRDHDRAT